MSVRTSNIFRVAMLIAGIALLSVFSTSSANAAKQDTAVCDDLSGNAFGICQAAVSSGCATDGRNAGANHCDKLASNFTKFTGDEPVWLVVEEEPAPVIPIIIDPFGSGGGGGFYL